MQTDNLIALSHILTASVALVSGAAVLIAPKGTLFHKRTGYVFALSLLLTNGTAALLYNLTGTVNFLHVFIVVSMCSLLYGMGAIWRRQFARHVQGMTGAALGVWAAGIAELTVRVLPGFAAPQTIIWTAVGTGVVCFFLIGFLIHRFLSKLDSLSA
ncbi:MAG: hypothetical protein ACOYPR_16250 [Saprospiraceae bacterium]